MDFELEVFKILREGIFIEKYFQLIYFAELVNFTAEKNMISTVLMYVDRVDILRRSLLPVFRLRSLAPSLDLPSPHPLGSVLCPAYALASLWHIALPYSTSLLQLRWYSVRHEVGIVQKFL